MKGRKHRNTGGTDEPADDIKDKPVDRSAPNKVASEAEQMKKGGRMRKHKKHGGGFGPEKHGSDEPKVAGAQPNKHAGRAPRKSGGRAGSDSNPFTSARKGKDAPGRSLMKGECGYGED